MKLSINEKIINKNDKKCNQAKGFQSVDLTPEELSEHIKQGHAFSFQFSKSHRKSDNFLCSDVIAADIDDGMTWEEAMEDKFIKENASLLYTTASHTSENHRFRIVFQLPQTVVDAEQLRYLLQGLVRKFPADKANTDPGRQFYGSENCKTSLFNNVMSIDSYELLLKLGKEPIGLSDRQDNKGTKSGFRSGVSLKQDCTVRNGKGILIRLSEMNGSESIYCPFHHDKNPSAFTTVSKSGTKGIHCSKCQVTYWMEDNQPEPYDFLHFDKLVNGEIKDFGPSVVTDESGLIEIELPDPNLLLESKYLPVLPPHQGITLIKSPKGTGKTTYLKNLVNEYRKQGKRVLLVGHRRSLLRALSESLGLECYLDAKAFAKFASHKIGKYFAISVDSMATMLKPNIHKFDVVLIDESEQVFSHLIADTIDITNRRKCYLLIQHYIHAAKNVIALDADLNQITLHAIQRIGNRNPLVDRRLILNEYKSPQRKIELYSIENQVIGDLFESIKKKDRVFVCCNSKKKVDSMVESIRHEFGDDFPLFFVTSDNSNSHEVTDFLINIKTEILKYKVVLVSPAMGTGIDITFPEEISHVDGVYGLFEARINTHFDIDQQLSRVRHPKYVRVWISKETFNFETEIDPIKQEIAESGIIPEILTGFTSFTGIPDYNWNDSYLTLYATILAAQRASKNELRQNFINLRTYNGWIVEYIEKNEEVSSRGYEHKKQGKALRQEKRIQSILDADVLDPTQVDDLKQKEESGKSLSMYERDAKERYFMERFYCIPVTRELVIKDNENRYREQIMMFERVVQGESDKASKDKYHEKVCLLRELYQSAGIFSGFEFNTTETITNEKLKTFVELCRKKKVKIDRVFGTLSLRKDFTHKPMQQLGQFLSMTGIKTTRKVTKTDGVKIYNYNIDDVSLGEIKEIVQRRKSKKSSAQND